MTPPELEDAYVAIIRAGWPNETGPWIDAMDLALRKHHADHQFLIVGFGLGRSHDPPRPGHPTDGPDRAAWLTLLGLVNKRARSAPQDSDPGYGRTIRPASVLPAYRGIPRKRR